MCYFGLEKFKDKLDSIATQLDISDGEKQLFFLAKALLYKPKILLFDESYSLYESSVCARL